MTQNEKDILFKDLCARLPYGVKCEVYNCIGVLDEVTTLYGVGVTYSNGQDTTCRIDECKPYLFPLSSMNEEQRKEYDKIIYHSVELHCERYYDVIDVDYCDELQDFYHKNHFDYRGLIPMGIAIDATGKNIY